MAAGRRLPALRLEVLLRGDREVEPLLTLHTAEALWLHLVGSALGTPLRLAPALCGVERLVGRRELELGLALQAREHESSGLLSAATVLARLRLGEVQ